MTAAATGAAERPAPRSGRRGSDPAPYLSVVVPAYNEEERIAGTLGRLAGYLSRQPYRWEIVVADDGSTDATAETVRRAAAGNAGVRLLRLDHRGKGWAVRHGMLAAAGEYRLLCDADLSVPIDQVERLLPPRAPEVDVALGSREAPGARRHGEPLRRHLMGRIFNWLVRRLLCAGVGDSQCGFKCFRRGPATELFGLQTLPGFAYDVEIIHLARRRNLSVAEIGVDWHYRDQSKVRPVRDALAMTRDLLRIRWRHRRRPEPLQDGRRA